MGFSISSMAVLPLIAGAVAWFASPAGALTASATLHAAVFSIVFNDSASTPADVHDADFVVMLNPKVEVPNRPSGWTAPAANAPQPTPPATSDNAATSIGNMPATSGAVASCTVSTVPWFTTKVITATSIMCTNRCAAVDPANLDLKNANWGVVAFVADATSCPDGAQQRQIWQSPNGGACQTAGYGINSSGVCNVTNASIVQRPVDNKTALVRSGNTWINDTQDITDQVSATNLNVVKSTTFIDVYDAAGNQSSASMGTDGTVVFSKSTYDSGSDTTTKTTTTFSAPNATTGDVFVTGTKSETLSGGGKAAYTSPAAAAAGEPLDITGLNQQATQAEIKSRLDAIHTDLTTAPEGADLAAEKQSASDNLDLLKDGVDAIGASDLGDNPFGFTWFPSIPDASCEAKSLTMGDKTMEIDYCPTIAMVSDLLAYVFYILTAFALFGILTRQGGS